MRTPTLLLMATLLAMACDKKPEEAAKDFPTPFETSNGQETATYEETISFYLDLAKEFPQINVQNIGSTDSGKPLHLVTYNKNAEFNFKKIKEESTVLLINNGIHPGEPDGIDATMLLFRDLASGSIPVPEKTVIVTIPIYNIGGALNRNSTSRANQNGPNSYGFRGNAKNYDLNRDFIKADTQNARTFAKIFHLVRPDIFIDNHVSNGADYQYTLTHLFTQHNKLGGDLGHFQENTLMPSLADSLAARDWDITPYVNVFNKPPEGGFTQFMDHPRYSTGYTTLWNTLGLMVETHMLKPYAKRVEGTYQLMKEMIGIAEKEGVRIKELRQREMGRSKYGTHYPTAWQIDSSQTKSLSFKGYKVDTLVSDVTGLPRLKYHRDSTFTKPVTYYNVYKPIDSVPIPKAYVLKKAWNAPLELLALNQVAYEVLKKDTVLQVESYKIVDFNTVKAPYEGHYLHYDTQVEISLKDVAFKAGDIVISTDQPSFRYIMETLEPQCVDSFFNWNFFDAILQQKEGFSPYVFEDTAAKMLEQDTVLRAAFHEKKRGDQNFAKNGYAQLDWLFKRSPLYEAAHNQYPVYRVLP
jgi:hypothetical protein